MNEGGGGKDWGFRKIVYGVQFTGRVRRRRRRRRGWGGGIGGKVEEKEDERGSSRGPEWHLISFFFLFPGGLDGGLKMDGG